MESTPHCDSVDHRRQRLLARTLEDIIRRRDAGELVSDEEVLAAHPHLMPHLAERLRSLRCVEEAESRYAGSSGSRSSTLAADASDRRAQGRAFAASIGGYELTGEIHRGGQGAVFRALQKATGRDVAIKMMHDGPFIGSHGKERFRREILLLGRLKHPNIVTIHDSGIAAGGHYFVMDYVDGVPLDRYTSTHDLPVATLLRLFVKIARAVNAAHLRGVIHRDLKPGNILIDQRGEPMILDFGLAKAAPEDVGDSNEWRTVTQTGQFVGSLPWSSPEQAGNAAQRIDLRTDVYSLGVILFQMLTRRFPYAVSGNMRDILGNILDARPAAPSSVRRGLDADVDTIVLKCLEKEPERRYQSADAVAADVDRCLSNAPILARAPSTMYQLRKLASRHRIPTALLSILLVLITAFGVWLVIDRRRDRVVAARAIAAERRASSEAEALQIVNRFLVNDMLAAARPERAQGRDITVKEVLEAASARIDGAFPGQPPVEASIRDALGQSYQSLGLYAEAERHLRRAHDLSREAFGPDGARSLKIARRLAMVLRLQARYNEAEPVIAEALRRSRSVFGDANVETLHTAHECASLYFEQGSFADARSLLEWVHVAMREVLGKDDPDTLAALADLHSAIRVRRLDNGQADGVVREAYLACQRVFGDDHPRTLQAMVNLAHNLAILRRFEEAEPLFDAALAAHQRLFGPEHPETLALMWAVAHTRQPQGRLNEAIALLSDTVERGRRALGADHPMTVQALDTLGHILGLKGECDQAERIHRETLALRTNRLGADHPATAESWDALGLALRWLGRHAEAEECGRHAIRIYENRIGRREAIAGPLRGLVRALAAQGKLEEARPLAEEYLGLLRKGAEAKTSDAYRVNCYARALLMVEPADLRDPQLALEVARRAYEMSADSYHYNRYILSLALEANGDTESAIAMMRRAREHIALEDSEEHRQYETALVRMLERTGDADAAEDVYRETLAARREQAPEYPVEIAQSLARLGETLTRHGKAAESEYVLTECLDVLGAALPKDDWRVGEAMSLLGESLAAQGRQDVARTLLVEGLAVILDSPMAQSEYARLARRRLATFGHAEGIDPGHGDTPGSDRNARSSPDGGGAQNSTGSATAAGEVRNP